MDSGEGTVETMVRDLNFYRGKKVFVTGHTGFKGTWLCKVLELAGAQVTGYALPSPTTEGGKVFAQSGVEAGMRSVIGDVRDLEHLQKAFNECQPEIVLHLAAQPLVIESYRNPVDTYATNVMGTVNILECVRQSKCVKSFLNVTTDKVYDNQEQPDKSYQENDPLDGYDPYANSKSCSELVTHSYKKSFFADERVAISTARAGNVIGGGDFADNRIVPDCLRAASKGEQIIIRHPLSTRPYQHVLEPLCAYLLIAAAQYQDGKYSGCYNVGPDACDCVTTGELADLFCQSWGQGLSWAGGEEKGPHEATFLQLNASKAKKALGWTPLWSIDKAVAAVVDWHKEIGKGCNAAVTTDRQIIAYQAGGSR